MASSDEGEEEGGDEDENDVGEEEPPFSVVGGVPSGDVDDEGAEAAGVGRGFEPAGEANEDGEDEPEVEVEEQDTSKRTHVVVLLPRDVEAVSTHEEVHGDTEAELGNLVGEGEASDGDVKNSIPRHSDCVVEEVHEDHAEDGHAFENRGLFFAQGLCGSDGHGIFALGGAEYQAVAGAPSSRSTASTLGSSGMTRLMSKVSWMYCCSRLVILPEKASFLLSGVIIFCVMNVLYQCFLFTESSLLIFPRVPIVRMAIWGDTAVTSK